LQGNRPSAWWYAGIGAVLGCAFAGATSVAVVTARVTRAHDSLSDDPSGATGSPARMVRVRTDAGVAATSRSRSAPPTGSIAAKTGTRRTATSGPVSNHNAGIKSARVVRTTQADELDQPDRIPLVEPKSPTDQSVSHAEEPVAGSAPAAEWSPATARTYWVEYLRPRLSLTPAIEDALRTILDERRWPFEQWNPGRLRTMIGDASDPVLGLAYSEPFQQFEEYLSTEQRAIFQLIAPRRDPSSGILEVRLVPDSATVAAAVSESSPMPAPSGASVPIPRGAFQDPASTGR